MSYSIFSVRNGHYAKLARKINVPRYVGTSTTASIGPFAAQRCQTTIGSTATIANCQACYLLIYGEALGLQFSESQAAEMAAAAVAAYAAAINAGLSQTLAMQAAAAAATAVALADDPGYGGQGALGLLEGEAALLNAFSAFISLIPVANQAAAIAAWRDLLLLLGIIPN